MFKGAFRGIGCDPTRDSVGDCGVVETGYLVLSLKSGPKRKYYRGLLMHRGFFGFYLTITVGWLNLSIRHTWILYGLFAFSKRTMWNTLECPSYCNFTFSCKWSIGQLEISLPIWAKEDLCFWFLVRLNGRIGSFPQRYRRTRNIKM